jgi:predicted O-methyltransferase YrrM
MPALLFARIELKARLLLPGIRRSATEQAQALRGEGGPQAERLARALERLAADRVATEAHRVLDRVEAARRTILLSPERVPWTGERPQSVGRICARASQPPSGARLLHHIVAAWEPRQALELGTCVGISAAYQATAIRGTGTLTSLEAYPALARQAEATWRQAGIDNARVVVGQFANTLAPTLAGAMWDYAFIDGHHQGPATERYVEEVSGAAAPGALLALDDIDYSEGMRSAWQSVRRRPDVAASAVVGKIGLLALR